MCSNSAPVRPDLGTRWVRWGPAGDLIAGACRCLPVLAGACRCLPAGSGPQPPRPALPHDRAFLLRPLQRPARQVPIENLIRYRADLLPTLEGEQAQPEANIIGEVEFPPIDRPRPSRQYPDRHGLVERPPPPLGARMGKCPPPRLGARCARIPDDITYR